MKDATSICVGHAFMQGVVRQNDEPCYSFSGTLKRIRERNAPA